MNKVDEIISSMEAEMKALEDDMNLIEADEIVPNLWQGSYPKYGPFVAKSGFTLLVLCAEEIQPPASDYPGVRLLYAPNSDDYVDPILRSRLQIAIEAAHEVVEEIEAGGKVLVTCAAGLNRSGLVSALSLHFMNGWSGSKCIAQIKAKRDNPRYETKPLDNPMFRSVLTKLPSRKQKEPLPTGWEMSANGLILPKM